MVFCRGVNANFVDARTLFAPERPSIKSFCEGGIVQRVVVIGTSGSGKSTLGETLARRMNAAFVELDSLFWEPGWMQVSTEVFRARVSSAIAGESWVVGGNYSRARDLIWSRADTLIWLDYSFPVVIWRLFRRTVKRI